MVLLNFKSVLQCDAVCAAVCVAVCAAVCVTVCVAVCVAVCVENSSFGLSALNLRIWAIPSNYRSLLQKIVSFVGLFCKRDLQF